MAALVALAPATALAQEDDAPGEEATPEEATPDEAAPDEAPEEAPPGETDAADPEDAEPEPDPPPREPTPDEDRRARELFQLGDRLYEHGQYDAAIDAFEEAYRLSRRPLMLFNLANAQERAGYLEDAIRSLEGYRPHAPADEQVAVANRIAALRERVESGEPPTPPDPVEPPDPIEAPPDPVPPPDPIPPPPPAPEPDLAPAAAVLGVAGAFLVAGVVLGVAALDARAQVDARCSRTPDDRHVCPADVDSLLSTDTILSGLTDASFVLAAAGTALGVYLLADALSGGSEDSEASVQVGGAIVPGAARADLRVRF